MSTKTDEFGYDLNRTKQRQFAYNRGYFWLACALCGFERGGHESTGEPSMPIRGQQGLFHMVCRRHPDAATEFEYVEAHIERKSPDLPTTEGESNV
jgi:hypothetical protein